MKFLLDVCVSSQSLTRFLVSEGHDVLSALAVDPKASDQRLMDAALQQGRVLVTEDKDCGELVFIHRLPHGPIVRLVNLMVDEQVQGMQELLVSHCLELSGPVIVTVTHGRIRIRRSNEESISYSGSGKRVLTPFTRCFVVGEFFFAACSCGLKSTRRRSVELGPRGGDSGPPVAPPSPALSPRVD